MIFRIEHWILLDSVSKGVLHLESFIIQLISLDRLNWFKIGSSSNKSLTSLQSWTFLKQCLLVNVKNSHSNEQCLPLQLLALLTVSAWTLLMIIPNLGRPSSILIWRSGVSKSFILIAELNSQTSLSRQSRSETSSSGASSLIGFISILIGNEGELNLPSDAEMNVLSNILQLGRVHGTTR